VQEIYLKIGSPFDLRQRHLLWIGSLQQLAVNVTSSQLLDFSQMCDDDIVDPVDDFFAGIADSVIDHVVIFNNIILIESLYLC
jgi:hypothetical protein